MSDDSPLAPLLDHLARGIPGYPDDLPPAWIAMRNQCETRERVGRPHFGDEYMRRDNPAECFEELADGVVYLCLDIIKARRLENEEHLALAMTAALHAYRSYEITAQLWALRHQEDSARRDGP